MVMAHHWFALRASAASSCLICWRTLQRSHSITLAELPLGAQLLQVVAGWFSSLGGDLIREDQLLVCRPGNSI